MKIHEIKGICPIIAAPFTPSGVLDEDSLRRLLYILASERKKNAGCMAAGEVCAASKTAGAAGGSLSDCTAAEPDRTAADSDGVYGEKLCGALTLFGIAGEYYKLSDAEQTRFARIAAEEAPRLNVPLIMSVTKHSTYTAVEEAKKLEALGADCLMLLPPFFLKPSGEQIYRHMLAVCRAVKLPVMIQYAPEQTGVTIPPEILCRLSEESENARYYKIECKPSGGYISSLLGRQPSARVFAGNAGYQMIEAFDRGAVGVMPGCSMFDVYRRLYDALTNGDRSEAMRIHARLLEILNHIRQNVEMIIYFEKRILKRRGFIDSDFCREPAFVSDRYFDRLFDEYYERVSELFIL